MTLNSIQNRKVVPLLVGLLLSVVPALGQHIPASIKQSPNVTLPNDVITDFVQGQAKALTSDNPNAQKSARQALMDQVAGAGLSSNFLDAYATAVNDALLPLAADKKLRVRLNAAIANGEIARKVSNHRQAAATLAFMQDKTDPVALWGLKAAKFEIPAILAIPAQLRTVNLPPAVVETVKAHSDSGPIIEEAYQALTLETTNNFALVPPGALPGYVKTLSPEVLKLLEFRVSLYADGVPVAPQADNSATLFLTREQISPLETPAAQRQTMKEMEALTEAQGAQLSNPGVQNKSELVDLFKRTGRAFQVLADRQSNPVLQKAAAEIAGISADPSPEDLQRVLADLKSAIGDNSASGQNPGAPGGENPVTPAINTASPGGQ